MLKDTAEAALLYAVADHVFTATGDLAMALGAALAVAKVKLV